MKRGKEIFVLLKGVGKFSVRWLRLMVEELIRGENLSDFYRSFRSGDVSYLPTGMRIAMGGFWSYRSTVEEADEVSLLYRRDVKEEDGVTVDQMRKVVNFFEPHGKVGSREEKTHCGLLPLSRLVGNGRRSYVELVVRKGHDQKIEDSCRDKLSNLVIQKLQLIDGYGKKVLQTLREDGMGGVFVPLIVGEVFLNLSAVNGTLEALKKEVKRCLNKLEVGLWVRERWHNG
jgi:hypothetical protein